MRVESMLSMENGNLPVEFLANEKRKRIFQFLHLNWCRMNLWNMANDIHLLDTLTMVENKSPRTYEGEVYGCTLAMLCAFYLAGTGFEGSSSLMHSCETNLTILKAHAIEAKNKYDDLFNLVEYYILSSTYHVVNEDLKSSKADLDQFTKITSKFSRDEDREFAVMIKQSIAGKASLSMELFKKRTISIIDEHSSFIYNLMKKSILQFALLSSGGEVDLNKLLDISKMNFSEDYDEFIREIETFM
jgi:hypothetical protein